MSLQGIVLPKRPRNEAEIKSFLRDIWKVSIPDVVVTEGHKSPFEFFCDIFLERVDFCIGIGSRASGKTFMLAALHALNCLYKQGYEITTAGAIADQALKCFNYFKKNIEPFKRVINKKGEIVDLIDSDIKREVSFISPLDSKISVIIATMEGFNGPHPIGSYLDEFELVEWEIYQEFLNMAISCEDRNTPGGILRAQNVLTSTRKRPYGTVERVLRDRHESGLALYLWNVWDVTRKCNMVSCRDCEKIVNGITREGSIRTFASVCKGKLKKSNGFRFIQDVQRNFKNLDMHTWEAQQECLKPSKEGSVFHWLDEDKHIVDWDWNPEEGDKVTLYEGLDWGGSDPNVCCFWAECGGKWLMYDEIYIRKIAPSDFAKLVLEKREFWKEYLWGNIEPLTYGDPAGLISILEFKKNGIEVESADNDISNGIGIINQMGSNDAIFINKRCSNAVVEWLGYHYPDGNKRTRKANEPVGKDDHTCDASRYIFNTVNPLDSFSYGVMNLPRRKKSNLAIEGYKNNNFIQMSPNYLMPGLGFDSFDNFRIDQFNNFNEW